MTARRRPSSSTHAARHALQTARAATKVERDQHCRRGCTARYRGSTTPRTWPDPTWQHAPFGVGLQAYRSGGGSSLARVRECASASIPSCRDLHCSHVWQAPDYARVFSVPEDDDGFCHAPACTGICRGGGPTVLSATRMGVACGRNPTSRGRGIPTSRGVGGQGIPTPKGGR